MTQRRVAVNARMLAEARQRRRELDARRDEQDLRQEEATAVVMEALAERDRAASALGVATNRMGDALRALLAEEVTVERAAALLRLDAGEVRRLAKCRTKDAVPRGVRAESAEPDGQTRDVDPTSALRPDAGATQAT